MEELVNRYRGINWLYRCIGAAVLALLPAAYTYYEESTFIKDDIAQKEMTLQSKRATFERQRSKANNLPELEEQLAYTQGQMEEARKRLPDDFFIEDFLAKLATFAQENLALMTEFVPAEKPTFVGGAYQYEELVIDVKFQGTFEHVVSFLDEISHLQTMVHLRDIEMTGDAVKNEGEGQAANTTENENIKQDKNANAIKKRAESVVSGSAKVAIFRSSKNNSVNMPIDGPNPDPAAAAPESGGEG